MDEVYSHTSSNIHGYCGTLFEDNEIRVLFGNEIKRKLLDTEGTDELVLTFEDLSNTGFNKDTLTEIFDLTGLIYEHNAWRIGEALSEYFLEQEYDVRFHYNELRDARNPLANKTGADIIGFVDIDGLTSFAFGEIKTSNDPNTPPQVLYGRIGLINQLETIANNPRMRNALIRYLGMKVKNLDKSSLFRIDFEKSLQNYIGTKNKGFNLFGVLVRDTTPNEKDCKPRYKSIYNTIDKKVGLRLMAIYIPFGMEQWESVLKAESN